MHEIRNGEENVNNETFMEYLGYQNPSFLAKILLKANQIKNNHKNNQNKSSYLFNE